MAGVSVQFLGSGDAFGSGGRFQTCIHVQTDGARFLIDCGASSLTAMKQRGVDPAAIDAILVTHLHGDHFGGIPFFILDAQFSRRTRPLLLAGPPGVERRVREAMEVLFPGSSQTQQRFPVTFLELADGEETAIGTLTVAGHAVVHASGAPAYALRVGCAGRVIAYSGDTEWTDALVRAAAGADLFICEAYSFAKQIRFHLDHATLMQHCAALGCRRLVLTHMGPEMLAQLAAARAECAADGMVIDL